MNINSKIFVAGHNGLVGSAIIRNLRDKGFENIIVRKHSELDLTDQQAVDNFFNSECPDYVFLAAAKVGGIHANKTYPADFILQNILIQTNVINSAHRNGVQKLLFLGSSCIYPKYCPQPIKEEYLLSGYLEPSNEAYAIAKICGLLMCKHFNTQYGTNFISVMPTNLYGMNDNFDLSSSHVLPALIRKFHEAKLKNQPSVEIWGSGKPMREFLYVDDMADACVFLMEKYCGNEFFNIGTGKDLSIEELAGLIKQITGFQGEIVYNTEKPDGTPRKVLDVSRLSEFGWKAKTELRDGIQLTYDWFSSNYDKIIKERRI